MRITVESLKQARRDRRPRAWLTRQLRRGRWALRAAILVVLVVATVLWERVFITIEPGHAGVFWNRFGGGTELCRTHGEGLHVIAPWNRMYVYNTRLQQMPVETVLYSQDGLEVAVVSSLRYRLNRPLVSYLHHAIGEHYEEKLLRPEVISALRKVIGDFTPLQIYSEDEKGLLQKLQSTLQTDLREAFDASEMLPGCQEHAAGGYVLLEDFLLLEVRLPDRVEAAVQYKLEQEQYAHAYEYILIREADERRRRVIEAQGIREFQEISGVPILQWRGIEATEKLATSNNAKVVITGTGADQLPVILNADSGAPRLEEPARTGEAVPPIAPMSTAPPLRAPPPPAASAPAAPENKP
jgi:regulator of protease activity HflC (stomatin/prohibitin superfamily)